MQQYQYSLKQIKVPSLRNMWCYTADNDIRAQRKWSLRYWPNHSNHQKAKHGISSYCYSGSKHFGLLNRTTAFCSGFVMFQSAPAKTCSLTSKLLSPFSSMGIKIPVEQRSVLWSHNMSHHRKPSSTDGQKQIWNTAATQQPSCSSLAFWADAV